MHKINTRLVKMMKAVELVIAVLLMIAIAISTLATVCFGAESLMNQSFQLDAILEKALTLVVGVEFVKMLILHTPESRYCCMRLPVRSLYRMKVPWKIW